MPADTSFVIFSPTAGRFQKISPEGWSEDLAGLSSCPSRQRVCFCIATSGVEMWRGRTGMTLTTTREQNTRLRALTDLRAAGWKSAPQRVLSQGLEQHDAPRAVCAGGAVGGGTSSAARNVLSSSFFFQLFMRILERINDRRSFIFFNVFFFLNFAFVIFFFIKFWKD